MKQEKLKHQRLPLPEDAVGSPMHSPLGRLMIIASSAGLHAIGWDSASEDEALEGAVPILPQSSNHPVIRATQEQLAEYFEGARREFDLPLVLEGTLFQRQAWRVLQQIPFGETVSYQDQARALGDLNKARAVGAANGKNPIPIVVPCHRVIAKDGSLHGFTGGLDKKRSLLEHERRHAVFLAEPAQLSLATARFT